MRYRRLSFRYTLIGAGQPRPLNAYGSPFDFSTADPQVVASRGARGGVALAQPHWSPPHDIYETAEAMVVVMELAGVDHEAIEVQLFDDAVVIEGERRLCPGGQARYHAAAIRQGPFRAEVVLPVEIDPERVNAEYDRGLLRITLPKRDRGGG